MQISFTNRQHINISATQYSKGPTSTITGLPRWNELHITLQKQQFSCSCVLFDFLYVSRGRHHHLDEICHEIKRNENSHVFTFLIQFLFSSNSCYSIQLRSVFASNSVNTKQILFWAQYHYLYYQQKPDSCLQVELHVAMELSTCSYTYMLNLRDAQQF